MRPPRRPKWRIATKIVLPAALLCLLLVTVSAGSVLADTPQFSPQRPGDPPPPEGEPGVEEGRSDSGNPSGGVIQTIIEHITHTVEFSAGSLVDAWSNVLARAAERSLGETRGEIEDTASAAMLFILQFDSRGLDGVAGGTLVTPTRQVWSVALRVAFLLFPLVLVVNVALVMTQGLSAPVARAEMLETLLRSLLTMGLAAGSFLVTNYAIRIGWATTALMLNEGVSAGPTRMLLSIVGSLVGALFGALNAAGGLVFFYLFVFIFIMAMLLLSTLVLSYYALLVVTVFEIAIAPLVITLGAMPPFRWVYGLWIKILAGILLLPVANAILLRLWAVLDPQLDFGTIVRSVVNLGLVCLMISINFKIGQFVFAPAMAAAKMAFEATKMVGQALLALGVIASAGGAAGLAGAGSLGLSGGPLGGGGGAAPSALSLGDLAHGVTSGLLGSPLANIRKASNLKHSASGMSIEGQSLSDAGSLARAGNFASSLFRKNPLASAAFQAWSASLSAPSMTGSAGEGRHNPTGLPSELAPREVLSTLLGGAANMDGLGYGARSRLASVTQQTVQDLLNFDTRQQQLSGKGGVPPNPFWKQLPAAVSAAEFGAATVVSTGAPSLLTGVPRQVHLYGSTESEMALRRVRQHAPESAVGMLADELLRMRQLDLRGAELPGGGSRLEMVIEATLKRLRAGMEEPHEFAE